MKEHNKDEEQTLDKIFLKDTFVKDMTEDWWRNWEDQRVF